MIRPVALVMLMLLTTLSGCGEPERPRYVPSKGDVPRASTTDRSGVDRSDGSTTIPKNIPMH